MSVTDVREIWIGPYKITGRGRAEGEASYRLRGALAVQKATLWMDGEKMELGEDILASDMHAELDARIDNVVPREHRGRPFLRYVSGRYRASGYVASLGFLNEAFGKKSALSFKGRGHLSVDAALDRGILGPGSSLSWEGEDLSASAAGFSVRGKGSISGGIGGAAGRVFSLMARWSDITVTREGLPPISIDGPGLTASFSGPQLDLASDRADLTVALDLPRSRIKDLSVLNGYLPEKVPFDILPGSGAQVQGHVDVKDRRAKGSLSIAGKHVGVGLGDQSLRGGFYAELNIADGNLQTKVFDISASKVGFRNGTISDAPGGAKGSPWSGETQLSKATLQLSHPASFQANITVSMKDTRPVIALFAPEHKAVRWFKSLLNIKDVTGRGAEHGWKHDGPGRCRRRGKGLADAGAPANQGGAYRRRVLRRTHHFSAAARIRINSASMDYLFKSDIIHASRVF